MREIENKKKWQEKKQTHKFGWVKKYAQKDLGGVRGKIKLDQNALYKNCINES